MLVILKRYLKPYRLPIVLVLLLTLVSSLLDLLLPTLMADVVDIGIVHQDIPFILKTGVWMIACSILAVVVTVAFTYLAVKVSLGFGRDLRSDLFSHVERFSLQEYERFGAASLITRTTNDIKQVESMVTMLMTTIVSAPLMLIAGTMLAVSRDAALSLVFLAVLPVLLLFILLIFRRALPLYEVLQKKTDRLNLIVREALTGARVIRAFNRVEDEQEKFNRANRDYRDTGIQVGKLMSFLLPIIIIVFSFTNIALVWFGAIRIDNNELQVGNLMAFLQYAMMILFSLIMLSMSLIWLPSAQASAKRINEVFQVTPSIAELEHVQPFRQPALLEFRDVSFRFENAEKAALEGISFTALPGQTTAIIGSTGAGKTTLLRLIPRLYDVEQGAILVGGVDIRQLKPSELRSIIGYVSQKASLFSGSIAENVRLGNEEATDAEVLAALEVAQAQDFIKEKGIEAHIEQAGANLSGGQKQRLSIARAIVRDPQIYLFDDSFSALDYKTDARLRAALKSLTAKKKAIELIVAQRVHTVIDAEQIIVLNEGKLAGIGTHQQLLAENKIYQEIVQSQAAEGESA